MTFFEFLWLSIPVLGGPMFRSSHLRIGLPRIVKWFYIYMWVHGVLALFVVLSPGGILHYGVKVFLSTYPFAVVSCLAAFYFAAFESFHSDRPHAVPIGVRTWALFSRRALIGPDGAVNPNEIPTQTKSGPLDIIAAKMDAHTAKVKAYELEIERQRQEALEELHKQAEAYETAKERVEELDRLRTRNAPK